MKKFNDIIGNRTRDLPACGAVPQPTAPPRAPYLPAILYIFGKGRHWAGIQLLLELTMLGASLSGRCGASSGTVGICECIE